MLKFNYTNYKYPYTCVDDLGPKPVACGEKQKAASNYAYLWSGSNLFAALLFLAIETKRSWEPIEPILWEWFGEFSNIVFNGIASISFVLLPWCLLFGKMGIGISAPPAEHQTNNRLVIKVRNARTCHGNIVISMVVVFSTAHSAFDDKTVNYVRWWRSGRDEIHGYKCDICFDWARLKILRPIITTDYIVYSLAHAEHLLCARLFALVVVVFLPTSFRYYFAAVWNFRKIKTKEYPFSLSRCKIPYETFHICIMAMCACLNDSRLMNNMVNSYEMPSKWTLESSFESEKCICAIKYALKYNNSRYVMAADSSYFVLYPRASLTP